MSRSPCFEKKGLKKGPWSLEEDQKLIAYIEEHGLGNWQKLSTEAGLQRCGKSCRLRWMNYLRPDIKRGKFSVEEDQTIIRLHALLGNKWSMIAAHLPKRTDNDIKNYWNSRLKKRLIRMGVDPITHKPQIQVLGDADNNLIHMTQWENIRLETEAKLFKLKPKNHHAYSYSSSLTLFQPSQQPQCVDVFKAWQSLRSSNSESLHNMYHMMQFNEDLLPPPPDDIILECTKNSASCDGGDDNNYIKETSSENNQRMDDSDIRVVVEGFRAKHIPSWE